MEFALSQYSVRESCTIEHLPDEILEFIIGFVSPYLDLQNCALVCKRWHAIVQRK